MSKGSISLIPKMNESLNNMRNNWDQVVDYWHSQGILIQPGCSENKIKSFEEKNNVVLPADFSEYLKTVNGVNEIGPNAKDENGFLFLPLEKIVPLTKKIEKHKLNWQKSSESDSLYIFCDYFDESWWYGIKLCDEAISANEVLLVCCNNPIKIADSFSDFIELYLKDSEWLYPPAHHTHG